MPKPQRCRRICHEPKFVKFSPDGVKNVETVSLSTDEFEVIRLVDYESKTHKECAAQMDISRTTVTEIYENARRKIADSIINGRRLVISGGNYRICDGSAFPCCGKKCKKQKQYSKLKKSLKGENIMKIAVTYENGEIFQHFGHTEQFKFYDVENGKITDTQVADTNGSGHGALSGFLTANKVDVLICGGIGGGAQTALSEAGIQLYGGVSGKADDAVNALITGTLSFNPNVSCSHHNQQHGNANHTCGEHGCGEHNCH